MNIGNVNLQSLKERYFDKSGAPRGERLLQKHLPSDDSGKIQRLLRSHLVEPITGRAVVERNSVDDLLWYYSILELASIVGYVPENPDGPGIASARHILSRPTVRRYYEKYYPLMLPQAFLCRLQGHPVIRYGLHKEGQGAFVQFMRLTDSLETPEVGKFLWMLDDGHSGREHHGLGDLIGVVSDERALVRALSTPAEKRGELETAAGGLMEFLDFCGQLDTLLQGLESYPTLQSALWHLHGYWFMQLSGQVLGVMSTVIELYRDLVSDPSENAPEEDRIAVRQTQSSMDRLQMRVQRVTSGIYQAPLERLMLVGHEHVPTQEEEIVGDLVQLRKKLELPVIELDLSGATAKTLNREQIQTVGELVSMDEKSLQKYTKLKKSAIREVTRKLDGLNLQLGMNVQRFL